MITFGILGPVGIGGGGGGVGTLQTVTDAGNVTTNAIQIGARLTVTNPLGTNQLVSETSAGNFINTLSKQTGLIQNSGNGLLLPQVRKTAGVYHPTRADHVIFADLSGGGVSLDVDLDNALLAFPGLQVVVKLTGFNAGGSPGQGLKLLPQSGTIDGQSAIVYKTINLFAVRVTNDGTNWWVLDVMTGAEIVSGPPTITVNGGAGAGATALMNASSSDNVGQFTVNFGAGTVNGSSFCTIHFARSWPVAPRGIFLQTSSSNARGVFLGYSAVTIPTAGIVAASFNIFLPDDGLSNFDGLAIEWMFTVVQ